MADFRLPMSAGAETSSVSFDPRRQVASVGDDEITQVTQSGGTAAGLSVADTIQQQFNATEPAAAADGFTASGAQAPQGGAQAPTTGNAAAQRDVPREVAKMLEGKYAAKRGVWKDITNKKADQVRLKNKAFTQAVAKKKTDLKLLKRQSNQDKSIAAQASRRKAQQQTIDGQMARRLRMQAGPERPQPAQPQAQTQAPQIAPGEPTGPAAPAGKGPTHNE